MYNPKTDSQRNLVEHALSMFRERGIKGVRMDDVANEMRVSKRTLYEMFIDKEHLLLECVKLNAELKERKFAEYLSHSKGVIDILCFFVKVGLEEFSNYNAKFFVDVLKYQLVKDYIDSRKEKDIIIRKKFFREGVRQGLLVDNVNFDLLARVNEAAFNTLVNEKIYDQYLPKDIFNTFIMVFLRGILTEKGLKELENSLAVK